VNRDPHSEPERLEEDLAAYALGALGEDEVATLERHVDGCDACAARLLWLQPAVDVLPASVAQLTPPPELRENLMEMVRGEAAVDSQPARAERSGWWSSVRTFAMRPATAMAVAILLVAGIGAGYLLRGTDTIEPTLVKAEAANGAVPVSATLERVGDSATLHVNEMPPLGDDEVYEVWVQRAGVMEPRSTFVLSSDGTAEAAVPGPLNGADAVLVTREPRGGSRQPTSDPLLQAPLAG
jgi:anti-sigma-K factor RskA